MDRFDLKITDIIPETHDAVSVFFEEVNDKKIIYEAGQFITLLFNRQGKEIRRSYSFSSAPLVDNFYSITVKRTPNGEISRYFTDRFPVGQTLQAIPPSGRFIIPDNKNRPRQVFFIAAGSGIVPIFSLLKKLVTSEPETRCVLIYQNHRETDIIFNDSLRAMAANHPESVVLINLISKPLSGQAPAQKLHIDLLEQLVIDNLMDGREQLFYLCGPLSFMRMAQFTLKWMGYEDDQIRKENFVVPFIPLPPLIHDTALKNITIRYQQKTFVIQAAYPKNILQAALDHQIAIPYSCRGGICSTCVAVCKQGKVSMSINEVLSEKEVQDGLVLTCVGYAETDIELDFL